MRQLLRDEACLPLNDGDHLLIEKDLSDSGDKYLFESLSNSDPDSLFDSDDEADTISDTDPESPLKEVGNITDDDDDLFEGEVRCPREYYIAKSNNLDVGQLRQERYGPLTQNRLDWVKEHHGRYVPHED